MARRRSNPLALAVLECLSEQPMHPYEISATLRTRGKEHSIKLNYGSLYSVVESLHKQGLIRAQETTREGRRPERTVYAITESGLTEMEEWLADLLATPTREYTSLEAGLSLAGALPPDDVAALLDKRTLALRLELTALEKAGEIGDELGLPEVFSIESRYRHALLQAELDFVGDLVSRIRNGTLGGAKLWRRMHELRSAGVGYDQMMSDPVGYLGEEAAALARIEQNGKQN
jgi:DNA-binding PadR family transcriptional regulator